MKFLKNVLISGLMLLFCNSCGSRLPITSGITEPVVIYKTKKDYQNKLSVQLSSDGRTVTAFPAPSEVMGQKPVQLAEGYLLKRMVGDAFLSLSIEEYATASQGYTSEELLQMVIDKDPYLEKYDCSGCTGTDTTSLNILIRTQKLKKCKSLL